MTFKVIQGHWKWHESIRPQILGPIVYRQRSVVNNCGKCFPTVDWNCAGAPALDNRMKNRKIFCNSGPFIGAYPCCRCCCWHILWNPSPAHSMLRVSALYTVAVTVAQNRPSCTFVHTISLEPLKCTTFWATLYIVVGWGGVLVLSFRRQAWRLERLRRP